MSFRAGIVGLGQVAWRFDEEPGREANWTHVGAYRAAGYGEIVAFDSSPTARAAFAARHPDAVVVESITDFVKQAVDVISICTPNDIHARTLKAILPAEPKAIWCEKPLATDLADGRRMVAACAKRSVPLVVSHVRRWSPMWRRFKARIYTGEIGTLRSLRVAMPNRLWSIGSHAVDILLWLGGPVAHLRWLDIPALREDGEPAPAALFAYASGAVGHLQVTGMKSNLIVEAEAIGDLGRLSISEAHSTIRFERFEASARFDGYKELAAPETEPVPASHEFSPFTEIAREILALLAEPSRAPTCSGADALRTQEILARLAGQDTDISKAAE